MLNHLQKLKKDQKGFTIIEVMIVLAIAGLIILVVLLAVPALQRNSRNTTIKSDASAVAGAIGEYEGNNDGLMPTGGTISAAVVTVTGTGTSATGKVQGGTTGTISPTAAAPATGTVATINVKIGNKCNGNVVGSANARSVAILYNTETTSTTAPHCLEG